MVSSEYRSQQFRTAVADIGSLPIGNEEIEVHAAQALQEMSSQKGRGLQPSDEFDQQPPEIVKLVLEEIGK